MTKQFMNGSCLDQDPQRRVQLKERSKCCVYLFLCVHPKKYACHHFVRAHSKNKDQVSSISCSCILVCMCVSVCVATPMGTVCSACLIANS